MRNLRSGLTGLFGAAGLLVTGLGYSSGCNSDSGGAKTQRPIDSAEATAAVNQHVDDLIAGLAKSSAQMDTTDSTTVATQSAGSIFSGSSCGGSSGSVGTTTNGIDGIPKATTKALDQFMSKAASEAKEHVFRDELVESNDGNKVIYKIDPVSACGSNSECVAKLTQNPVRFAVTANTDDSLNVALLVGEARHTPATALLSSTEVSVRANLAEVMDTLRLFATAADLESFPDHLNGVIEAALERRSESEFAISGSVIEKFDLLVGQAKGKPVAVTVAPSDPTWLLTLDSATNTLGYSVAMGAVDVKVAGAAVCNDSCGSKEKTGSFSGHLGGYSFQTSVSKGATELNLSGVGLGNDTTYVALDDDRLGTLDVNPNQGRKFSMNFKRTAEGTLVTFEPALDIKLALMLNKLSDSLRVDMPDWLSDEIFEIMLGGAAKPSVLVPAPVCDAFGNASSKSQLAVVTGDLTLSSSSPSTRVDVTAGMCLLPVDGAASDANPVSRLKAGACQ
jgi:hypothetical protein